MKNELKKLLTERKRLAADLERDPIAVNSEGKEIPKEPTAYLAELDRRIARLQKRG